MKRNLLKKEEDSDPMSVVSNLFDVAMVFAVALMVALVSRYNMTEVFSQEDFTMVKNPGKENMEIITKEGNKINKYTPSENQDSQTGKKGKKVRIAKRNGIMCIIIWVAYIWRYCLRIPLPRLWKRMRR